MLQLLPLVMEILILIFWSILQTLTIYLMLLARDFIKFFPCEATPKMEVGGRKANGKHYIGESNNIINRLAKHTRNLMTGVSDCTKLQKDWNLYGSSQFKANVICIGPEWETQEARLKKENELICSCSIPLVLCSKQPLLPVPVHQRWK